MKVWLEKTDTMCMIGNRLVFNFDNPGPTSIDEQQLTSEEVRQLVYNINRGILASDNYEGLQKLIDQQVQAVNSQQGYLKHTPQVSVSPQKGLDPAKTIQDDLKKLKKLLEASVETIQRTTRGLNAAQLRRLKELEEEGRNRKSVITYLDEVLWAYVKVVTSSVGNDDVGGKVFSPGVKDASTQIGDIVESDVTEITLKQE